MIIDPHYVESALRRFGLDGTGLLGKGGESWVYSLDEGRVLRIWGPGTEEAHVLGLQQFYATLDTSAVGYAVPRILEVGREGSLVFSVDARLAGRSLSSAVADLSDEARRRALTGLTAAAGEIRKLGGGFSGYGELLAVAPLRRDSWAEFLLDRANATLRSSRRDLEEDVPRFDEMLGAWMADVKTVVGSPAPALVHGDYFPGNLLVDDTGDLTAVIDFSPHTVSGDWRLDVAGALVFLEMGGVTRADDQDLVSRELAGRYGVPQELIDVYHRYYALYFSATKFDDRPTYDWCVETLSGWSRAG